jgi:hypothetical protein
MQPSMSARGGLWFPRATGAGAIVLAVAYVAWCVFMPPAAAQQIVFGRPLVGPRAWIATALHAVFFAWLAYACLRRRRAAVWGINGYCVSLLAKVWPFPTGAGRDPSQSAMSLVIIDALFTAVLLAFCRVVLDRRDVFDR